MCTVPACLTALCAHPSPPPSLMQMGSDRVIEVQPCMIASTRSYTGVKALCLCPAAIALPVFSFYMHIYGSMSTVSRFFGGRGSL